jgi:hypothetical protein
MPIKREVSALLLKKANIILKKANIFIARQIGENIIFIVEQMSLIVIHLSCMIL